MKHGIKFWNIKKKMKQKINNLLNNHYFEKFILILIILNLLMFILDTVQEFHNKYYTFVQNFELISVIIFTLEYFLRIFSVEKLTDIFKPMMIIDFMAIAPFYLSFITVNTIFLRIFRLSKILRILKLGRYSEACNNILEAFKSKKEELIITLSLFIGGILISSILLYIAENESQPEIFSSIPKCFYFAVITFTSVGYGDITPVTILGKFICSLTAILGIGLHGLFIGVLGTAFMAAFKKD